MSERRIPFMREGDPLDKPSGWHIYDEAGKLVRTEWNPDRHRSSMEKFLEEQERMARVLLR